MTDATPEDAGAEAGPVGLCAGCVHAVRQPSARGSVFWRCRAAERDRRLLRYPPLPVTACPAYRTDSSRSSGRRA